MSSARHPSATTNPPRLLIEDWLPAAAIGVECMRERGSASALAPHTYLHVWWARRPLTAARAAVLASLLPSDFPRDVFERLLGFWGSSQDIIDAQETLNLKRGAGGERIDNPHGGRAFKANLSPKHLDAAHAAARKLWGDDITVIDPMSGGGSIPLESARLGFKTVANEYNPVACSVLEATVDYPFRFGPALADKARKWGRVLRERFNTRMARFYPSTGYLPPHCYIFARTVPCPDTGFDTPLVPDWYLLKPKGEGRRVAAVPLVDRDKGTWRVQIKEVGRGVGQIKEPPPPSYGDGKGISVFTHRPISADYIKAMAQQGRMQSVLYAVAIKTPQGLKFQPPEQADLDALVAAEKELKKLRPAWEKNNVIPTEKIPVGDKTGDPATVSRGNDLPLKRGETHWTDFFMPRQLLATGVLVEELNRLGSEIRKVEGDNAGEAAIHLLAFVLDKFYNHNCNGTRWENTRGVVKSKMDRHDYAFKLTFAELAPCNAGTGFEWTIDNVTDAYQAIADLPHADDVAGVEINMGSATSLPHLADQSVTAVVVDPPYDDNVQYSELADFFYVWLKRTQGHRRPEWFSTYLCEHDQEAVVNASRFKKNHAKTKDAKAESRDFYRKLMAETFAECGRILRDDGVLTVMFTHKKQEAWEALFASLVQAGFKITATWPVKTESEHSLHQAKKNAAQSTVILVSRKRPAGAGVGYYAREMKQEIRERARKSAERLMKEGLNPVDQLVGSFGPAMEVYSQYDEVRTDTGQPVGVDRAIDEASDAVSQWRIDLHAERGLEGVEAEGKFVLLCWDVLGAAEFRFNEAHLLSKAVGMEVEQVIAAGLVSKSGDKIRMLSAQQRRRERALTPDEAQETLFGPVTVKKKRTKKQVLKVHPNDPMFRTALDACHALALRYVEAGAGGVGSAKALARQQNWVKDSAVAMLMQALVLAAPEAVKHEKCKTSAAALFPEFRAWHALLQPLFGIEPPDWTAKAALQGGLFAEPAEDVDDEEEEAEEATGAEE
ncbi:MAG: DUF1156 domain-containing protein [Planctomycetota bacterium]|nr:DUF1156 domain-containing protein [Planctomycetota bacterium]